LAVIARIRLRFSLFAGRLAVKKAGMREEMAEF
jgi:hypothetical protein